MIALNTLETHLGPIRDRALTAGVIGAGTTLALAFVYPNVWAHAYLQAVLFWVLIALGCLALMLIHNLTGGVWGHVTRRLTEAGAQTFPLLGALFLPVLFSTHALYEWADAAHVAKDEALAKKAAYLNIPFFCVRTVFYFAVWSAIGAVMTGWARKHDVSGDAESQDAAERWAGPALAFLTVTLTFAGIDWLMSLQPHWVSAVYGVIFGVSGLVGAHAFTLVFLNRLVKVPGMERAVSPGQLNDLGNFLLGFVMFWTYVTFAQFLIIWSGNIAEEVTYYVARSEHGWLAVAQLVAFAQFVIPFLLLLSPSNKRDLNTLWKIAALVLFARVVDIVFLVAPVFRHEFYLHALDLTALVAVGGFWIWGFIRNLLDRPLKSQAEGGPAHG